MLVFDASANDIDKLLDFAACTRKENIFKYVIVSVQFLCVIRQCFGCTPFR